MKRITNKIICFFYGHRVVDVRKDNKDTYCKKSCSRCGVGIGMPHLQDHMIPSTPPRKEQIMITPRIDAVPIRKPLNLYTQAEVNKLTKSFTDFCNDNGVPMCDFMPYQVEPIDFTVLAREIARATEEIEMQRRFRRAPM